MSKIIAKSHDDKETSETPELSLYRKGNTKTKFVMFKELYQVI